MSNNNSNTYTILGSDWAANVELNDKDVIDKNNIHVEVITRAVEALIGKRKDVKIKNYKKHQLADMFEDSQIQSILFELMTDELEPGCRIGMLFCIFEKGKPQTFFSSKIILQNVGLPKLVAKFDKKYPDLKEK